MLNINHKIIYSLVIPIVLGGYLILAGIGKVTLTRGELFPFFSWSLFSGFHEKADHYMIVINSIDGSLPDLNDQYISANNHPKKIRVEKAIRTTLRRCIKSDLSAECYQDINRKIIPIINDLYSGESVNFSVVLCSYTFEYVKAKFLASTQKIPKLTNENCEIDKISGPWESM